MENIRNFCIIAHIDHGKSTLADRMLEITKTVEPRQMKAQFLDQLELERERGITIKMAPVRMKYETAGKEFVLNLIDTPGHSDFSYEVSRALLAVEGAVLLVDAAQGIQAQTLANFESAKKAGLKIIGALNKVDLNPPNLEAVAKETADLIGCPESEILRISGKTGQGVEELLAAVVERVPPPKQSTPHDPRSATNARAALIFDSLYDEHKGVIAFVRVFSGKFTAGEETKLAAAGEKFKMKEVGVFAPFFKPAKDLLPGEIGYIATGIKNPDLLRIGDTAGDTALAGYEEPRPRVFVSFFPEDNNRYADLKKSFQKLKLNDPALEIKPDSSEVLGRGFKIGFLGKLHFEITSQRLEKEFDVKTVNSFPSVSYRLKKRGNTGLSPEEENNLSVLEEDKDGFVSVESSENLPDSIREIWEPMIDIEILTPSAYFGGIFQLKDAFRMEDTRTENISGKILLRAAMPLAELISDFDDKMKSVSEGFASFSYRLAGYRKGDLRKIKILINGEAVTGLAKVVPEKLVEREARNLVKKLKEVLPQQQFSQALQAVCAGRVVARENISALKKDVTGYLYGGDRTRKMKLWKKQKKGKEKLLGMAKVRVPAEVFKELLKKE